MDRVDGFAMYDTKMSALDGRTDGRVVDIWMDGRGGADRRRERLTKKRANEI